MVFSLGGFARSRGIHKTNGPLRCAGGPLLGRWTKPISAPAGLLGALAKSGHGSCSRRQCSTARSLVKALLVGFVGRYRDHADRPALELAPRIDRVAGQAVGAEDREQHA